MPAWLARTITWVVATSAALSVASWTSCTFWIGPQMWQLYVKTQGKLPAKEPDACRSPAEQAQATLSGLLATLLALRSNPPKV
jgi:hypothetical protein